ncbi:MAG: hypothetical protein JSR98_18215 [Proteobacteria bacterium]|nr:hypothetical protein [Pseudomonadota bacterium]
MSQGGLARRIGPAVFLGVAALGVLAILGFYAQRLSVPLPLFAADEVTYLLHALYPDEVVARNPYVASANNGVHLSVIRAVFAAGLPVVIGDRIANLAAYLIGLLALWWASVKRTPVPVPGELGLALLLLAIGFPYYRFAASNLAEGLFVGVFAAFVLVTRRWWRSRPLIHATLAGALGAALVLVKPNGVAELGALLAVGVVDAILTREASDWLRLPVRLVFFAVAFFLVGNLIQWQADEPIAQPWRFFISPTYSATMAVTPPKGAAALAGLGVLTMVSASALLAGAPAVIGLADLWRRWRAAARTNGGGFDAEGGDLAFLLVLGSLAATIAMVGVFTMKVAIAPGETLRIWGRYFEFFIPMVWVTAAPALARGLGGRTAAACAVVTFLGLASLLVGFRAGIVLFPWDASELTAFFQADPVRAPLNFALPLRALSILAVLLAGAGYAARLKPAFVGLALILVLGGLSTWLDGVWMGPLVTRRLAFEHDIEAIRPRLLPVGDLVFLSPNANQTHLAFLTLDARPHVVLGPPDQAPPGELASAGAAIVAGPETPPGGPWSLAYRGQMLSLYQRAAAR